MQKRCLTIQDYSCLGRCSLTVALPIISACGIECVGIPTAVLSNHTAFPKWTYQDLSQEILPTLDCWKGFRNDFDVIYTGYLGVGQEDIVKEAIQRLKQKKTYYLMDPAFGDNGKLYPGFDDSHVEKMKELLPFADGITPNITEACFLTGVSYQENYDEAYIQLLMKKLAELGPKDIIISGISYQEKEIGAALYQAENDTYDYYARPLVLASVHGAGDCFASVIAAGIASGLTFSSSLRLAHGFVRDSLKNNIAEKLDARLYGPIFEPELASLARKIENEKRK